MSDYIYYLQLKENILQISLILILIVSYYFPFNKKSVYLNISIALFLISVIIKIYYFFIELDIFISISLEFEDLDKNIAVPAVILDQSVRYFLFVIFCITMVILLFKKYSKVKKSVKVKKKLHN